MIKRIGTYALIGIACMFVALNAFAESIIKIQPMVHTSFENNSNFWKAQDEEVSVNTYLARPGVVIGIETPKMDLEFDGTIDFFWYDDQDTPPEGVNNASDDDFVGATMEGSVNYQISDRVNIGVSDEFYITRDPARSDGNSNSISRDKYTINYFEPNVYYEFADKFGLMTKYRNTITDYEEGLEDSTEHRGIFDLFYILNRTSAIYVDYSIWERDYDQESIDYLSNRISLNYEREYSWLSIKGGAGYHHRSFDEDSFDDLDLFSWRVELSGIDEEETKRTTRRYLSLDLGQEMNDDGTGDSYFVASYIRAEATYLFIEKVRGIVKAGFQNSDYDTDERDEDTYYGVLGVGYMPLDFLTLGIEGGLERRDSNIDGNDYDDSFVMLRVDIDYDLGSR